jgi:hypothetical protein
MQEYIQRTLYTSCAMTFISQKSIAAYLAERADFVAILLMLKGEALLIEGAELSIGTCNAEFETDNSSTQQNTETARVNNQKTIPNINT